MLIKAVKSQRAASQFGEEEEEASPDASQANASCLTASAASSLAPRSRSV